MASNLAFKFLANVSTWLALSWSAGREYARTDNGHEFHTKFHWHVSDLGMLHVYIEHATPMLNGKIERSNLNDEREFYQMLYYDGEVYLRKKLGQS